MSNNAARLLDERRWSFGAWLTAAVAVAYVLSCVIYALAAFRQPSEGWNASYDLTTGWITLLNQGGAQGLQIGDRILAIEGLNLDEADPPRHDPPANWRAGATARYTVVRDGETLDLQVPLVQIPASALPYFMILGVDGTQFATLLALLSGVVIFLLRPGSLAARLLLLFTTFFGGTTSIELAFYSPALAFLPPLLYWFYRGTGLLWPLMFAMITHLALSFPLRTWPLTHRPRAALGALYGLTTAAAIASIVIDSQAVFAAALLANVLILLCAVVGATIHNLRFSHDPIVRAQIGWMALGLAGSFMLAGLSAFLGFLVPSLASTGGYLTFLLLPICLGIAILRYRLFDIDIIIRRTLVYTILTITLGLVYLGCILLGQALATRLTGNSEPATVASTLVIAALFFPLRRRIQNLIDRRFYRQKYNAQQVLANFALLARDETDLARLTDELLRVVDTTVQPEFAGVWLATQNEKHK